MMRSLFSGISGLKNHQTRMDVIGNNIANVNTTAFKGSRVTFQDMLSQNLAGASGPQGNRGGVNAQQIGLGMTMASIDRNFTNGNVQSTGANNDLCLTGSGFFMVGDGASTYYTRDGSFRFDERGNYVNGNGYYVQGWMADDSGNVNTNGPTGNISIPYGQTMPAKATNNIQYSGNLSADDKARKVEDKTLYTEPGEPAPAPNSSSTSAEGVITEVGATVTSEGYVYTYSMYLPNANTILRKGDVIYDGANPANPIGKVASTPNSNGTFTFVANSPAGNGAPPIQTNNLQYKDSTGAMQLLGTNMIGNFKSNGTFTPGSIPAGTKVGDPVYDGGTGTAASAPGNIIGFIQELDQTAGTYTIATTQKLPTATTNIWLTPGTAAAPPAPAVAGTPLGAVTAGTETEISPKLEVFKYDAKVTTPGEQKPITFTVYDKLGIEHKISGVLEKTDAVAGQSTTWTFTPSQSLDEDGNPLFDGGQPVYRDSTGADISIGGDTPGSMTIVFDNNGKLDTTKGNPYDDLTLTQPAGSTPDAGAQQAKFKLDFSKFTGYGGDATGTKTSYENDGYTAGELKSVQTDSNGNITGTFSNDQKKVLARVALSTFTNPEGLESVGSNLYTASNNSGMPTVTPPGTGGTGITPSALEMSNVNMSEQFSDMIITQRGFQSNSKIITVSDEMLETLVNLKR